MRPKLTIGMATYDDYDGCYFTLQSLRMYNDLTNVELILVDNKPDAPGSADLKGLIEHWMQSGTAGARYIAAPEVTGTSAPRNRIFEEAKGEFVVCMDAHVLLRAGWVQQLIKWYEDNPESKDLLTGPLLFDDLHNVATHFVDFWRGEMWGIWGTAWTDGKGNNFSVVEDPTTKKAKYLALEMGERFLSGDHFPDVPYPGHERALIPAGFRQLGLDDNDVFEIPGQGLGFFSCRKEAWAGFNKDFRGFGGEEMYIHTKFRQRGDKCLCLGFLRWLHRFNRPKGVPYPLRRRDKVRNYIIGHKELNIPTDRLYEHFVTSGIMTEAEFRQLEENPTVDPATIIAPESIHDIYNNIKSIPRDLNEHMDTLKLLASKCKHITEFSHRRESFVAFAAAMPENLVSYNLESDNEVFKKITNAAPYKILVEHKLSKDVPEIENTDLLFIDQKHTYDDVWRELTTYGLKTSRFIILHDTESLGTRGEDNGRGLQEVIKDFIKAYPQWVICSHTSRQYGLTILCTQDIDKPTRTLKPWVVGGPGTEMSEMLESIGIKSSPTCDCKGKAHQMDAWGVAGCKENRDQIIQWIRDNQERWNWKEKIKQNADAETEIIPKGFFEKMGEKAAAAWKTVSTGLVFKLNMLDPIPSLVDEAIRRAEEKEQDGEYE